jgi:hypothetical protein
MTVITIVAFFIIASSIAGGFSLLALAASRLGVDSRPSYGDDHAR